MHAASRTVALSLRVRMQSSGATALVETTGGMSEGIGPGRLILVVGPSGAGKDTLIGRARDALRDDPRIVFPRRAVTRPPNGAEDHDSLTEQEFERALADGRFALAWDAHGLRYGIPVAIEGDLRAGRTAVCNVSRGIVDAARTRYERTLVVLVTAPPALLMQRLSAREREEGGAIAARIERNEAFAGRLRPDFTIDNGGSVEEGARRLIAIIQGRDPAVDSPAELVT